MELTPGIIAEKKRQVTENDPAWHLGSGSLPVLATPAVVAWMEHCATCVINSQLQPHETSVGTAIDVLHVKATAYAPGAHDNGQWGSLTHMGTTVRPGVMAVDPAVIPLGSRVYIEYPDGTGSYAVAEDTGGAIKGNRIDIAMSSVDAAYDFGIQNVKVYVLA